MVISLLALTQGCPTQICNLQSAIALGRMGYGFRSQ
jgi:hypothetical protein